MARLKFSADRAMEIHGSVCALVTPFKSNGGLDLKAFGRLLDLQIKGGTQAVVVAGSTGEAHMLQRNEYDCLLDYAVEHVACRIPVIAGTGEAGTAKTVALTQRARKLGADAALVVAPYYVRPTQEGLRRHFLEVAERGGLPVLLYNVPSRTACDLAPETTALLRNHPAIIGIKEARADGERIQRTAELAGPDFVYLSGDDGTAAQAMLAGAAGVVSVAANLAPRAVRALCEAGIAGDRAATADWHAKLEPLIEALNCAPNPIAVKAGLAELGLGQAAPRLPLVELEPGAAREQLRKAVLALASLAGTA